MLHINRKNIIPQKLNDIIYKTICNERKHYNEQ